MRKTAAYFALALVFLSPMAHAENWGHWRGPRGNGAAVKASPPTEWSSSKNVKWKVDLPGRENSSPVVWENQVFVSTAVPVDGQNAGGLAPLEFKILCFRSERRHTALATDCDHCQAPPRDPCHQRVRFGLSLHGRRACLRTLRLTRPLLLLHERRPAMETRRLWKDGYAERLWRGEFSDAGGRQDSRPLGSSRSVGSLCPRQADGQDNLEDRS